MDQEQKTERQLQKEAAQKEVSKFRSLEAVEHSEGGKLLLKGLKKDTVNAIDALITRFTTMPEHELRATCAVLRERILMTRIITRAKLNKKVSLAELEELSTEDVDEEDK